MRKPLAHHSSRNPRFNGSRTHGDPAHEIVDFRNNVIYNRGVNSSYGGESGNQNMIANYYKYGPATRKKNRIVEPWDGNSKWYISENYVSGFPKITADNWADGVHGKYRKQVRIDTPIPFAPIVTHTAEKAYELVLANVGANLPKRDSIDTRIINEVRTGTAKYCDAYGSGIIDSQNDVGGWPELRTFDGPRDNDYDGMADDWELANGFNPEDPNDRNQDFNGDGFTNLEKYLNDLTFKPHS